MGRVAIVADSSACLPRELIEVHRIVIVPLALAIDGTLYADGSLSNSELFARLEAARGHVQTTTATPGDFLAAFERERYAGAEAVLCLTLSSGYSSTFSVAQEAAHLAAEKLSGFDVRVVDTGALAMAHGFAVLAAARALESGACLGEAADVARRTGESARLLGGLDTLRFLVKGGRVPWVVGWAASLLRIKPVLAFADGSAHAIARPRTWPAAREAMLRAIPNGSGALHAAVTHVDAPKRAGELACEIRLRFDPAELLISEFTSVMAAHAGPGFVGLAYYRDARDA